MNSRKIMGYRTSSYIHTDLVNTVSYTLFIIDLPKRRRFRRETVQTLVIPPLAIMVRFSHAEDSCWGATTRATTSILNCMWSLRYQFNYFFPSKIYDFGNIWKYCPKSHLLIASGYLIMWSVVSFIKCQALISPEMCSSPCSPVSRCMAISVPHVSPRPLRTELNTYSRNFNSRAYSLHCCFPCFTMKSSSWQDMDSSRPRYSDLKRNGYNWSRLWKSLVTHCNYMDS